MSVAENLEVLLNADTECSGSLHDFNKEGPLHLSNIQLNIWIHIIQESIGLSAAFIDVTFNLNLILLAFSLVFGLTRLLKTWLLIFG